MSPSLRRLAVAGCVLGVFTVVPATPAAGAGQMQAIQNLLKFNLLQTVTHISDGVGKKDVEPNIISRTEIRRIVMAEAAILSAPKNYSSAATEKSFNKDKDLSNELFAQVAREACFSGARMDKDEKTHKPDALPDTGMVCLRLLKLSADEERGIATPRVFNGRPLPKELREPYARIQRRKLKPGTPFTADELINAYSTFLADNPTARESTQPVPFTMYGESQKESYYASHGVVFDARFTKRVLDYIATGAMPPKPTMSPTLLDEFTRACYDPKAMISNGQCEVTADGQSYYYLAPTVISANQATNDNTRQVSIRTR